MYKSADGRITYSNVKESPPKGSKRIRCFEEKRAPAVSTPPPQPQAGGDFPSVDRKTQQKRDDERLTILEQELAEEQQRLDAANVQLEEQESIRLGSERNYQRFLDRVQPYKDTVANHERNVQAIQSEIKNLNR